MAQKVAAKNGRPSAYSDELADEIFRRMAGGETLLAMCKEPTMPAASTIKLWAINDSPPGFSDKYMRAREFQADAIAEQALDLADTSNPADAAKVRIQVDTRKWLASKINPAKFGDRTRVDSTAVNIDLEKCSVDQLRRIAAGEPIAVVLAGQ